ncbi:MAG: 5-oxoprolinase subunit PxpA [Pirellulaceae bacterium]
MRDSMDLNCDVGEVSFALDQQLLALVSSCNVSCGAHAGDAGLITQTVQEAVRRGVAIGAHPSYPDRENFGRVSLSMNSNELMQQLVDQVHWLRTVVNNAGASLCHIKPHGALYHDLSRNSALATTILSAFQHHFPECAVYGMANSPLELLCESLNLRFVAEAFADRQYADANSLVPRTEARAMIGDTKKFEEQLIGLLHNHIEDSQGRLHTIVIDTICIHSDSPSAIAFAHKANQLMEEADVKLAPPRR